MTGWGWVTALVLWGGCASGPDASVVLAAASTGDVVHAVAQREKEAGRPTLVSVAASSVLARQIAQGAPADVFVTADPDWIDWLIERRGPVVERRVVATGRLVLVGPADAPAGASLATALASADRLALADPTHVPAGAYARESLEAAGLWDGVSTRVVPLGDVRAALAAVETGAADRAIVYASDATASERVRVLAEVPHARIVFEAALLQEPRGRRVFDALVEAGDLWADAGFDP